MTHRGDVVRLPVRPAVNALRRGVVHHRRLGGAVKEAATRVKVEQRVTDKLPGGTFVCGAVEAAHCSCIAEGGVSR